VLDETDGRAARHFNQSSTLGAVLDMVTDRQAQLVALPAKQHSIHFCAASGVPDIGNMWRGPEETATQQAG
jgi:CDP-alcohol phosphatidyltransferase